MKTSGRAYEDGALATPRFDGRVSRFGLCLFIPSSVYDSPLSPLQLHVDCARPAKPPTPTPTHGEGSRTPST